MLESISTNINLQLEIIDADIGVIRELVKYIGRNKNLVDDERRITKILYKNLGGS